jgi:hypothetical protein
LRRSVRDRPTLAIGGVHQQEPRVGIGQVQRNDRGNPVRVIVRMRHHHAQRPAQPGNTNQRGPARLQIQQGGQPLDDPGADFPPSRRVPLDGGLAERCQLGIDAVASADSR